MSLLFETISIRSGTAENLPWHQERMEASIRRLFGRNTDIRLSELIRIPPGMESGHYRCRIDYDTEITGIEFQPYIFRDISSLKVIEDNEIEYPFKYSQRNRIDELFGKRGDADDILIVKNGFITDTSVSNIIFYDGRRWITPSTPLLEGTCRARLLDLGNIHEARIKISDLPYLSEARMINAMRRPEDSISIPVSRIVY